LDEAVALSCNIDPDVLRSPQELGFGGFAPDDPDADFDPLPDDDSWKLAIRCEIALSQAGVEFQIVDWVPNHSSFGRTPRCLMQEFVEWAVAKEEISLLWGKLPDEFRSLAQRHLKPEPDPKPTAEECLMKVTSPATLKPAANRMSEKLTASGVQDSTAEDKQAATLKERDMLVIILALITEIRAKSQRPFSDAVKARDLVKKAGKHLALNTIKKFLNKANALKPVAGALEDGTATGKPLNTKERGSALTIIFALVTAIESKSKNTLTSESLGAIVSRTGHRLPDDVITQHLGKAKAINQAKGSPEGTRG
jgi:hypothetical protein